MQTRQHNDYLHVGLGIYPFRGDNKSGLQLINAGILTTEKAEIVNALKFKS